MLQPKFFFHSAPEVQRQKRALSDAKARTGLEVLSEQHLKPNGRGKNVATLYILGSGESVLDLRETDWERIARGTSIGIGGWALHPFVPDLLAIETPLARVGKVGLPGQDRSMLEESYDSSLKSWTNRTSVIESNSQILFFRPQSPDGDWRIETLRKEQREKALIYGRFGAASKSPATLQSELGLYFGLLKVGRIPFGLAFDTGSTVVRLVSLGLAGGFKKIVLAGVDLVGSRYFWESNPDFLTQNGLSHFFTGQRVGVHLTESGQGNMPVSLALSGISEFAKRKLSAEVFVASNRFWLSRVLNVDPDLG
jgi:hypothetical protein